jgi:zinc finger BED domain-containing protein 1 (E3 SUMO-protein ligase ZBED1)
MIKLMINLSHQGKFPYIARVARMVLTPPATSVPSERVFSAAANQIWARRNRLAASSVEKIMFLLNNLTDELALLILDD